MAYTDPSTLTWAFEEFPSSAKMNSATNDQFLALLPNGVAGVAWSPALLGSAGNPGISTVTGRQYRIGPLQFVWAHFTFSTGGTGHYSVSLPVAASGITANSAAHAGQVIGSWSARDVSAPGNNEEGGVNLATSTSVIFSRSDGGGVVGDSNPFVFASGDFLSFHAFYPVA